MDFSNRIRNRNTAGSGPEPAGTASSGPSFGAIFQSRPLLTGLAVIAGLAFSLGVMAGVPIGRIQQQEQDVSARVKKRKAENKGRKSGSGGTVSGGSMSINSMAGGGTSTRPDSNSNSNSNAGGNSGSAGGGNRLMNPSAGGNGTSPSASSNYVITLGTYSAANARKLLRRINRLPGIAGLRPSPCRTLEETVPNRAPGFRLRHPTNNRLNRVYLGCFRREGDAQRVLRAIKQSRIIPISHAKLIQF